MKVLYFLIRITCLCVLYPLTPHLYYTGVYIIFLFLLYNICFQQKYENSQNKSTENCHFYSREKSLYVAWACFRNVNLKFQTSAAEQANMSKEQQKKQANSENLCPPPRFFLRNTESSENVKFIGGFIHTRYILSIKD